MAGAWAKHPKIGATLTWPVKCIPTNWEHFSAIIANFSIPSPEQPDNPLTPPLAAPHRATLDEYLQRAEAHYIAWAEYLKARFEFRVPATFQQSELHADWLVRFKFQGWTQEQIATEYSGRQRQGGPRERSGDLASRHR